MKTGPRTNYIAIGILLINLLALGVGTGLAQTQEPDVEQLAFGLWAEDGTMIQPFLLERFSSEDMPLITMLPQMGGNEENPVVQQDIWIWMGFTTGKMTRALNYTIYGAENITDAEGTRIEYTKDVDNGTLTLTRGEFKNQYVALRRFYLGKTRPMRRLVLQYLDQEIEIFYQTHEAEWEQTLTTGELNIYTFLYVLFTAVMVGYVATKAAHWLVNNARWVPPPPNVIFTLFVIPIIFLILYMLLISMMRISIDRAIFNVFSIPAFLLVFPLFGYQTVFEASSFKAPLDIRGYFEMREPTWERQYYIFNWHQIPIYQRQLKTGQVQNCCLIQRGGILGYWDMLLRLLGKHLEIVGPLQGSLPSQTRNNLARIDIVTEYEFQMGSYQHQIKENTTFKTLGYIGLVLLVVGFLVTRITLLADLGIPIFLGAGGCLLLAGLFLLRNLAVQRNPGHLKIKPIENEEEVDLVLRIIHDRTIAGRYIEHFQTIAQKNIDLEADQYINILEQGSKIARTVVNQVAAKANLAPYANTDEIAKLLAWNKMDTEGLDAPEEIIQEIEAKRQKYLKELEEQENQKEKKQ